MLVLLNDALVLVRLVDVRLHFVCLRANRNKHAQVGHWMMKSISKCSRIRSRVHRVIVSSNKTAVRAAWSSFILSVVEHHPLHEQQLFPRPKINWKKVENWKKVKKTKRSIWNASDGMHSVCWNCSLPVVQHLINPQWCNQNLAKNLFYYSPGSII